MPKKKHKDRVLDELNKDLNAIEVDINGRIFPSDSIGRVEFMNQMAKQYGDNVKVNVDDKSYYYPYGRVPAAAPNIDYNELEKRKNRAVFDKGRLSIQMNKDNVPEVQVGGVPVSYLVNRGDFDIPSSVKSAAVGGYTGEGDTLYFDPKLYPAPDSVSKIIPEKITNSGHLEWPSNVGEWGNVVRNANYYKTHGGYDGSGRVTSDRDGRLSQLDSVKFFNRPYYRQRMLPHEMIHQGEKSWMPEDDMTKGLMQAYTDMSRVMRPDLDNNEYMDSPWERFAYERSGDFYNMLTDTVKYPQKFIDSAAAATPKPFAFPAGTQLSSLPDNVWRKYGDRQRDIGVTLLSKMIQNMQKGNRVRVDEDDKDDFIHREWGD